MKKGKKRDYGNFFDSAGKGKGKGPPYGGSIKKKKPASSSAGHPKGKPGRTHFLKIATIPKKKRGGWQLYYGRDGGQGRERGVAFG